MEILDQKVGRTVSFLRAPLDLEVTFMASPPVRRPLPAQLTRASVYHVDGLVVGFELDIRVSADTHKAVQKLESFGLAEARRGEVLGRTLDDKLDLAMTLFLRPALLSEWLGNNGVGGFQAEVGAILDTLADPTSTLASEASWDFLSVMQDVPGKPFAVGYRNTDYAEDDAHLVWT